MTISKTTEASKGCLITLIGSLAIGGIILWLTSPLARYLGIALLSFFIDITDGWTALDLDMSEPTTTHVVELNDHEVTLTLKNYTPDDGPVDIDIAINGETMAVIQSIYNYDLFSNDPAAYYAIRDANEDGQKDLVLRLNSWSPDNYYISGQDGKGYPTAETIYGPSYVWQ